MTKDAFLLWLGRFRHTNNIRIVVENQSWTDDELDRLKETLEKGRRLQTKNEYRRRIAWG